MRGAASQGAAAEGEPEDEEEADAGGGSHGGADCGRDDGTTSHGNPCLPVRPLSFLADLP